jgi:hypothetical protein
MLMLLQLSSMESFQQLIENRQNGRRLGMLTITIPDQEWFNDVTQEFVEIKGRDLTLEHSLVSLSKWESLYHKPFLTREEKTRAETLNYIKCMTITQNVPDVIFKAIDAKTINLVMAYIENPMTATTFTEDEQKKKVNRDVITAEIIYYWMVALQIPMECQKWHLNRLLTLINVCNIKNQPKKMSKADLMRRNKALNAQRRAQLNTRG